MKAKNLKWLGVEEAEAYIRRALKIPRNRRVVVKHANFGKIKVQKFFARFDSKEVKANFFADPHIAEREALILDYLNSITSLTRDVGFMAPKKLYHKDGLVIREKTPGEVLRVGCSDETIERLARLLLGFGESPVPPELKKHRLSFAQMKRWVLRQIPQAKEAFSPFRGSGRALDELEVVLSRDWGRRLRRLRRGFVHGDFQPANILLWEDKIGLIDFDRGGYFYPLFDVASFATQFTHAALLESYHRGEKPNRRGIRSRVQLFVSTYRKGAEEFNEEAFRLFKLLIIFNGLAFSTAGFRKKVTRGAKHLLFGLFRRELKWFGEKGFI